MLKVVEKFELNPTKLCGVTTDSAPSMTGRCSWSSKCSRKPLHYSPRELVHQSSGFAEVMRNVVQCLNYIRAWRLTYKQLKAFLDELDNEYPNVTYFSAVHWLNRAATLKTFWNLWQEIKFFMGSKHQNVAFLSDENWWNDLTFLTDITQHLSDLNLRLQGKS